MERKLITPRRANVLDNPRKKPERFLLKRQRRHRVCTYYAYTLHATRTPNTFGVSNFVKVVDVRRRFRLWWMQHQAKYKIHFTVLLPCRIDRVTPLPTLWFLHSCTAVTYAAEEFSVTNPPSTFFFFFTLAKPLSCTFSNILRYTVLCSMSNSGRNVKCSVVYCAFRDLFSAVPSIRLNISARR